MPKKNTDTKLIFSLSEEVLDEERVLEDISNLFLSVLVKDREEENKKKSKNNSSQKSENKKLK